MYTYAHTHTHTHTHRPLWLNPNQVMLVPVTADQLPYALQLQTHIRTHSKCTHVVRLSAVCVCVYGVVVC
jgi:threonyl-tRNA synthetase